MEQNDVVAGNKIAVIDIETTGFQGQGGLIIEIGIVGLNLDTGDVTEEFNSLVKEDGFDERHAESPFGWIFKNSDLKFEDVMAAKSLDEQMTEIQDVLNKFPQGATAFNKRFDFGFMKSRGFEIRELPCIMLSATPVVNIIVPGKSSPKWPKVQEAWDFFFPDTQYVEEHRGLDDAKHEALIALELHRLGRISFL